MSEFVFPTIEWEEQGFNSEAHYKEFIIDLYESMRLPKKPDFRESTHITVLDDNGVRNVKQVVTFYRGTPVCEYPDTHVMDLAWSYPVIDVIGDGLGISLAEFKAAGGSQMHRFSPVPLVGG